MPTKLELTKEIDFLTKKLARARSATVKAPPEPQAASLRDALVAAARILCRLIRERGLETQVGQKELRHVEEAIGPEESQ